MSTWNYNPRKLKIMQVSSADQAGGAESSAMDLHRRYAQLGHHSWLVVGEKFTDTPEVFPIPNNQRRSPWARLVYSFDSYQKRATLQPYQRMLRFLFKLAAEPHRTVKIRLGQEDFDFPGTRQLLQLTPQVPDIIHCHNLHGGYFDLRVLPELSAQRPIILNLRDSWLLSGHCAHSFDCERWKTGCGQCPDLKTYPGLPRDGTASNWQRKREIFQKSRVYVTAISHWLMDRVDASMLSGVKSRVIYNGIDTQIFSPGSVADAREVLQIPKDAKVILLTAHNEYKNLRAMRSVLENLEWSSQHELVFICLGVNGPAEALGSGRIIYAGREKNVQRMAQYYRASDVYLHAASAEAFGKMITEANACGVPVVATNIGGIPEQMIDGETGYLIPIGNIRQMTAAVQKIIDDPLLQQRLGAAGRANAHARFGIERQVDEFLNWYCEIIEDWQSCANR